jgi:hypothetical protein
VLVALCGPLKDDEVFTSPASVHEIAAALVVTDAAVKQHLAHLYDKFEIRETGSKRRLALAREAIRLGVVSVEDVRAAARASEGSLAAGRDAVSRHDWEAAYELLSSADSAEPLDPEDLELLAEAALWADHHEASFAAGERAFRAHVRDGNRRRAAVAAVGLTISLRGSTRPRRRSRLVPEGAATARERRDRSRARLPRGGDSALQRGCR